jgi:trans-2,3-dihydro-3-hydroxyanthranilate isomerase
MDYRYAIADVFTAVPFGGNQLAVFPDARGLSTATMHALTREFNFAESTFVTPPARPGDPWPVRIFTPGSELPFAGHPTVGTAAVLAQLGLLGLPAGGGEMILQEGIGPVPVKIGPPGPVTRTQFTITRSVESAPAVDPAAVAAALSLPADAVLETWFASVGVKFCFARVKDRDAVDRAQADSAALRRGFAGRFSEEIFFFAGDPTPGGELYARMFAPGFGIPEDAATGSAAAALAAVLASRLPGGPGTSGAWTIRQGVKMGRPALIEAAARKAQGETLTIDIGGSTVLMATGTMNVP